MIGFISALRMLGWQILEMGVVKMKPMYSFTVHLLIAAKAITTAEIPQISKFQSFLRQFLSSGFGMLWTFQSYWVLWDGRPSRLVSPWASPRVRQSERELRASGHPTESLGILKLEYITYIQHHTIYIYRYVPFCKAWKRAALSQIAYFHASIPLHCRSKRSIRWE